MYAIRSYYEQVKDAPVAKEDVAVKEVEETEE